MAFPVELITGLIQGRDALRDLAVEWAYALGMAAVALLSFRAGLRRFAAFGG